MASHSSTIDAVKAAGQEQLLQYWDELDERGKAQLATQLQDIDFRTVARLHKASLEAAGRASGAIQPLPDSQVSKLADRQRSASANDASGDALLQQGLRLIAQGKVAALCLAGGQGTRLGSSDPKGMFDIGLPSHKSLFQLQAERIRRLQTLAATHNTGSRPEVPLVILTSPATDAKTRQFFAQHQRFGLTEEQVLFAVQEELPCVTESGKIILESKSTVARAPNGNGGVFAALVRSSALEQLERRGVEFIDVYCVDNALARVADPHLAGHAHLTSADVCAKVLAKAYPEERVGVFALRGGATSIVEYSELDASEASAEDPATGRLKYNWANISHFCFTPAFVRKAAEQIDAAGEYHIARKKIPSVNGPVQGIKLEAFIFDPFPHASNLQLLEVDRESHFAPVKNANGSATDTPDTARELLLNLHNRWTAAAGGKAEATEGEISPLQSYMGEGLRKDA